jgi:hypothetical protein
MGLLRNMLWLALSGVAVTLLAGLVRQWRTRPDADAVDGPEGEGHEGMAEAEPDRMKVARGTTLPFDTPEPDPLVRLSDEGRAAPAE